jgi:hypothetical protein
MDKWAYERDLKFDLLATLGRSAGKIVIWASARVSCSMASTSADRFSNCCPALPQKPTAFWIRPASESRASGKVSFGLGNC